MTLDNEAHREFLLNALHSAPVQGRLAELRQFVATADEIEAALKAASVAPPLVGDDLHP